HSKSTHITVALVKTLAEIFLFLHNKTSADFPPPKIWWTGFSRPNSLLIWEPTESDLSPSKNGTDFFLSTNVSTRLSIRFSAVILSDIVPVLPTTKKNMVKDCTR
ncbi:hypothetical protein V8G54_034398, partial [Vigna mungo]